MGEEVKAYKLLLNGKLFKKKVIFNNKVSAYNIKTAYENKQKVVGHFKLIPVPLVSLVDGIYEKGYMPLVEIGDKLGWVYEKPILFDPSKLERTCDEFKIKRSNGFGAAEKMLEQIGFDNDTEFILAKASNDSEVIVTQFNLGKYNTRWNRLFGKFEHHRFLRE